MKSSLPKQIEGFLKKWRIVTSDRIKRFALSTPVSDDVFRNALLRLRRKEKLLTLSLQGKSYHFHASLKPRVEALEKLSLEERNERFSSWGFDHHLKVVDLGLKLEKLFPHFQVIPNLFSDHVSFATGSTFSKKRKVVPDLTLIDTLGGEPKLLFIEVECTLKNPKSYEKKWLAYERDAEVKSVLYWTFDRYIEARLQTLMKNYFEGEEAREDFELALVNESSLDRNLLSRTVTVIHRGHSQKLSLQNWLGMAPKKMLTACSPVPPFKHENINDFSETLSGSEQTPLPLPCLSTKDQEVAKATVRGVCSDPTSDDGKEVEEG